MFATLGRPLGQGLFAQLVKENCIHVIAAVHSCRGSKHVCLPLPIWMDLWVLLEELLGARQTAVLLLPEPVRSLERA